MGQEDKKINVSAMLSHIQELQNLIIVKNEKILELEKTVMYQDRWLRNGRNKRTNDRLKAINECLEAITHIKAEEEAQIYEDRNEK